MLALSVRSLDGSCDCFPVGTTLAEVRAQLEQSLPVPLAVKLLQGTRELADDAALEVEVQAVVIKSPKKALPRFKESVSSLVKLVKEIDYLELYHSDGLQNLDENCEKASEELMSVLVKKIDDLQLFYAERMQNLKENYEKVSGELMSQLAELLEMETLDPQQSQEMLEIMEKFARCQYHSPDVPLLFRMAEVFGRVCGDPSTYIPRFARACTNYHFGDSSAEFAACSLVEIVARCGGDSLPRQLHTDLTDMARRFLDRDHVRNVHYPKVALRMFSVLCKKMDDRSGLVKALLQKLSNMCDASHGTFVMWDELWEELNQHATVVLEELEAQRQQEETLAANTDPEPDSAAQASAGRFDEVGQAVDMAELAPDTEGESDPVLIHQQDLQEAIMRSKAEGPAPICHDDSVAIWRLTRTCAEAKQALSESPTLGDARKRVEDAGCSVFPGNANGACVLVPLTEEQLLELNLQLEKHHVLAPRSDKLAIENALRKVPPGLRPKLRDDHRAGPIEELWSPAEKMQETAPAASNDIFEEIEMLNPCTRAWIRQFWVTNERMSELSSMSTLTESAPCGDASCQKEGKLSYVNPRRWK